LADSSPDEGVIHVETLIGPRTIGRRLE